MTTENTTTATGNTPDVKPTTLRPQPAPELLLSYPEYRMGSMAVYNNRDGRSVQLASVEITLTLGKLTIGTIKTNVYINERNGKILEKPQVSKPNGKTLTLGGELLTAVTDRIESMLPRWSHYERAMRDAALAFEGKEGKKSGLSDTGVKIVFAK